MNALGLRVEYVLPPAAHTVSVRPTGTENPAANVVIDAIDVTPWGFAPRACGADGPEVRADGFPPGGSRSPLTAHGWALISCALHFTCTSAREGPEPDSRFWACDLVGHIG